MATLKDSKYLPCHLFDYSVLHNIHPWASSLKCYAQVKLLNHDDIVAVCLNVFEPQMFSQLVASFVPILVTIRLKSIKNIQKITKSMKMVAAAKYARAERQLKPARVYGNGAVGMSLLALHDLYIHTHAKVQRNGRFLCDGHDCLLLWSSIKTIVRGHM